MSGQEPVPYRLDDEEVTLDPIRYAAVTGAPLIVLSDGCLVGRTREALAVCGRADTLREVWGGYCRRPRLDAASRRFDPGAVMPMDGWDKARAAAFSESFREVLPCIDAQVDFLPTLCLDEAVSGACTVGIVSGDVTSGCYMALWLFVEGTKRARREGTPSPILVYDKPHQRASHGMLGIAQGHGACIFGIDGPGLYAEAVRCNASEEPTRERKSAAREEWARLLARFEAEATIRYASDFCWLSHEGGIVAMGWECDGSVPPYVWEIPRDGRCRMMVARTKTTRQGIRALRAVRRGGVPALAGIGFEDVGERMARAAVEILMRHEGKSMADEDRPSRMVDVAFEAAVAGHAQYEPIAYLVRSNPSTERARRDFVVTWPAFAILLLDDAVRARIDAGGRTTPLVAREAGISQAVARRLVGLRDIPSVNGPQSMGLYEVAQFMEALGHDNVPRAGDQVEWSNLTSLCGRINEFAYPYGVETSIACGLLLNTPGRNWTERAGVLLSRWYPGEGNAIGDASDMIVGFSAWLGQAKGTVGRYGRAALGIMLGHGSLVRIEDASGRWHADPNLSGRSTGLPLGMTWPVPFDSVDLGEGLRAVALDGVQALLDEGGRGPDASGLPGLDHCVGGYGRQCQTGASIIVSIRRDAPRAERLSTAELVRDPKGDWSIGGYLYALRQHRSRANGDPTPEASQAIARLKVRLSTSAVPVRIKALEPRPEAVAEADPSAAASLHAAWRRIMPPAYADLDLATLLERVDDIDPRRVARDR